VLVSVLPAAARAQEATAADTSPAPPPMPRTITRYASGRPVHRIERRQIAARRLTSSWQLLQGLPWIQLADVPVSGVVAHGRRAFTPTPSSMKPCYTRLAIDGVVLTDSPADYYRFMPTLAEIETLEIFTGPATIPSEFGGLTRDMQCGLIAVWTR